MPCKQKGYASEYLALAFHLSSAFNFLPSSVVRQPRSPSLPRLHSRSLLLFLACFFFLLHAYTYARTYTQYARRVRAAPSSSSSSSSAPLGHTHKSKEKERGHGIFQDGIFNALARSVTPGEPGPRDWPASPRIPGPSLVEPGPRPTPIPSVLPHMHRSYVLADTATVKLNRAGHGTQCCPCVCHA